MPNPNPKPDIQSTNLDLLLRIDRLLSEADAVRILRDRLISQAQEKMRLRHDDKVVSNA